MADKVTCGKCGGIVNTADGETRCSFCGASVEPELELSPSANAPSAPAAQPQLQTQPLPGVEIFSERMRANKAIAGRTCNGCVQPIELGDDVWNCQVCGETMHSPCHDQQKGCGNLNCSAHLQPAKPAAAMTAPSSAGKTTGGPAGPSSDYVDCTSCGEKILKKAAKCRFCGELQGSAARAKEARLAREATADDNLTPTEIIFGILCGGIACIFAIVWIIQGKKKGWKLLLISLVSSFLFQLLKR